MDVENGQPRAWSAADARVAAFQALPILELVGHGLELLRLGENAIFKVADSDVVLRVARPGASTADVAQGLRAAEALHVAGVPVGEPVERYLAQGPLGFPDGVVSAWVYYEQESQEEFSYADFGRVLERFHRLSPPVRDLLKPWNPLARIRKQLLGLQLLGVPAEWTSSLGDVVKALDDELNDVESRWPVDVIHGDAHSGNALKIKDGLIIVDLDCLAIGPREADFAPTLVQDRRFQRPRQRWADVAQGYGCSESVLPPDSPLIRAEELRMVVWLLQQWGLDESVDRELADRVASLNDPPGELTAWNPR